MRVGISVKCPVCLMIKKPVGRSAPFGSFYCDDDCSGYREDPKPGSLWSGESEVDFGYPCGIHGTKEVL